VRAEILSFYENSDEEERLATGPFQIEAARTRLLIQRFAPPPPAVVLDVGGAAGAYAHWLAALGYDVHLLDPVERHVDLAAKHSRSADFPLASTRVGDARGLPFEDGIADVVLLLGPLYHLTSKEDRKLAVAEASRVLGPGGILFAACISRWASLFDGIARDFLADADFRRLVEEDLRSGQHRNPTGNPSYFTTAHFHRPDEFAEELESDGLELLGLFGLEGPAALLSDFDERWADERKRGDLMRAAEEVEAEPSLLGLSPHLLGVCRRR